MASIARKNLFEDLPRLLVAQAGIMFAVSLVTIQTGILKGFTRSTALLIEQSRADMWVASEEMVHFELTEPLALGQVEQARQVEGVIHAEPLLIGSGRWRSDNSRPTPLRIFGFWSDSTLFVPGSLVQGDQAALDQPYSVIVDKTNLKTLGIQQIGDVVNIRSLPAKVIGITEGTQSIASSTFIFTSLESANAYINAGFTSRTDCKLQPGGDLQCINVYEPLPSEDEVDPNQAEPPEPLNATDPVTYILLQLDPNQDIKAVKKRLEAALPGSRAYTREEMVTKTQTYWQDQTGIGFILGLGAAVGIVVGTVIVGQILYSSVSDHLREFGTLKAMGASNWTIYSVILEQALWMAILGYIPGMALCFGLGSWTLATQGIVILITPATAVGVLGLTISMCMGSAIFAIQKVTRVDPAIVFKA